MSFIPPSILHSSGQFKANLTMLMQQQQSFRPVSSPLDISTDIAGLRSQLNNVATIALKNNPPPQWLPLFTPNEMQSFPAVYQEPMSHL